MTALILDAAAFIAVDRFDRSMGLRIEAARQAGWVLRTTAVVVAEVWRDPSGGQARLARLLRAIDVRSVDEQTARDAGVLLGQARASNPIDAMVVLIAEDDDQILTSDLRDIGHLADIAGKRVSIVRC